MASARAPGPVVGTWGRTAPARVGAPAARFHWGAGVRVTPAPPRPYEGSPPEDPKEMMVALTQKLFRILFRALDLVEEVRTALARARGETQTPPWESPPPPSAADPDPQPPAPPPYAPPSAPPAPASAGRGRPRRARAPRAPQPKRSTPSARKPAASAPQAQEDPDTAVQQILDAVAAGKMPALSPELAVAGKTMPARVIWSLSAAGVALGRGLTGPEMSALLTQSGVTTAANNIMRTIRQDGRTFFARTPGEGRAGILTLTPAGAAQAKELGLPA